LARVEAVRRTVRQARPDVIVCFQGGPFTAMRAYTLGMGIPLIAAERTSPTLYDHAGTSRHRLIEHQVFRTAARVTVPVARYRAPYPAYLRRSIAAIPSPVAPAEGLAAPAVPDANGRFRLLSVGRLAYQKNYQVLLAAFARVAPRFGQWDLDVVGDGEHRAELEAMLGAEPSLRGRVRLHGARKDVTAWYRTAHLFCLPARWED